MTPEAQRIAIAEACGFRSVGRWWVSHMDFPSSIGRDNNNGLPDFLGELNAMHEAEKVILDAPNKWPEYIGTLANIQPWPLTAHATAAQRAEAFLRTIGKWEENT